MRIARPSSCVRGVWERCERGVCTLSSGAILQQRNSAVVHQSAVKAGHAHTFPHPFIPLIPLNAIGRCDPVAKALHNAAQRCYHSTVRALALSHSFPHAFPTLDPTDRRDPAAKAHHNVAMHWYHTTVRARLLHTFPHCSRAFPTLRPTDRRDPAAKAHHNAALHWYHTTVRAGCTRVVIHSVLGPRLGVVSVHT